MERKIAHRFEDLRIYQLSQTLAGHVYDLTRKSAFAKDSGLVDQVRRASVSVFSNIAEGFERGSRTELVQFLFIAKGSCGEVRAQLQFAFSQSYFGKDEYNRIADECLHLSSMISNFIFDVRKQSYKGEKYR